MNFFRTAVVKLSRKFAAYFGGTLLSNIIYKQILIQRACAVKELVEIECCKLEQGLVCVVFSKDRALQLHALLNTYFICVKNPVPVFVIYAVSSDEHEKAYREVEEIFFNRSVTVTFVNESHNFRTSLLSVLDNVKVTSIFFLVDDIVFIRPFDLSIVANLDSRHTTLSLRHSPNLRRSYTANVSQLPPNFFQSEISPDLLMFAWFERGCEWSDPWSVDGHILSTAEVRVLSRISKFKAPNSYEVALKTFNDLMTQRVGVCFRESKILNLPINRVQNEIQNLSGSVSALFLLEQWNNGMMIDTSVFKDHIPLAPHEEHVIKFKRRS
ncbi:hypothetical protein B9Z35_09190 [Limnohabitans sp. Jir61]|uniref:hypothetical protein n=1 Tax=Limnohabitans sp. Jir61 TaxID=1826168 RepID=UPI000D36077E|nr:hypothetical protein [Limnohabitans sp. Jir61]PUE31187.1 hypothetical protein B9Z35_09190 [Limnohabitans sp. Jir61]